MNNLLIRMVRCSIFELPLLRNIRKSVFCKSYSMGIPDYISNHVVFRTDDNNATLQIGDRLGASSNVCVDYSGGVIVGNGVWLSEGCRILTKRNEAGISLQIGDFAWIGSASVISVGVRSIGKNAIVGAGAYVCEDVPENAVVIGRPARVIRFLRDDEIVSGY